MEKGSINSLLVVLMLIAVGGFAILSDNGSNSDSSNDDGENQQMEDEWDVYYVDSGDDLPNCNSDTLGRLYYVASTTTFEVCLTSGWSFIDIKGADGEQGPQVNKGLQVLMVRMELTDQWNQWSRRNKWSGWKCISETMLTKCLHEHCRFVYLEENCCSRFG